MKNAIQLLIFALVLISTSACSGTADEGGDAGKAFIAYNQALKTGTIEEILAMSPRAKAQEMRQKLADPMVKGIFDRMVRNSALKQPHFVNATGNGDNAVLQYSGEDGHGFPSDVTATMQREDGTWKVAKMQSKTHNKTN